MWFHMPNNTLLLTAWKQLVNHRTSHLWWSSWSSPWCTLLINSRLLKWRQGMRKALTEGLVNNIAQIVGLVLADSNRSCLVYFGIQVPWEKCFVASVHVISEAEKVYGKIFVGLGVLLDMVHGQWYMDAGYSALEMKLGGKAVCCREETYSHDLSSASRFAVQPQTSQFTSFCLIFPFWKKVVMVPIYLTRVLWGCKDQILHPQWFPMWRKRVHDLASSTVTCVGYLIVLSLTWIFFTELEEYSHFAFKSE